MPRYDAIAPCAWILTGITAEPPFQRMKAA